MLEDGVAYCALITGALGILLALWAARLTHHLGSAQRQKASNAASPFGIARTDP
jgi:hypothetical protein